MLKKFARAGTTCFIICLMLICLSGQALTADKKSKAAKSLPEGYSQKAKRMAEFISVELANKSIKTVIIKPFTDMKGRETKESRIVTDEFSKHLTGVTINAEASGADAVIAGILTPFKGREKWKIQITAVNPGTNRVITAYDGILIKPRGVKK